MRNEDNVMHDDGNGDEYDSYGCFGKLLEVCGASLFVEAPFLFCMLHALPVLSLYTRLGMGAAVLV